MHTKSDTYCGLNIRSNFALIRELTRPEYTEHALLNLREQTESNEMKWCALES